MLLCFFLMPVRQKNLNKFVVCFVTRINPGGFNFKQRDLLLKKGGGDSPQKTQKDKKHKRKKEGRPTVNRGLRYRKRRGNTKQTKKHETNEKIRTFRLFRLFSFVSYFPLPRQTSRPRLTVDLPQKDLGGTTTIFFFVFFVILCFLW
jgi:hypothetical protein